MFMKMLSEKFLFPVPTSLFVTTMSYVGFISLAALGILELMGKHIHYSKFVDGSSLHRVPSKVGMLLAYVPAVIVGFASFIIFQDEGTRFFLLRLALTIHFLKRVLEVLFVHKYGTSGIALDAQFIITGSYFTITATMIYTQHLSAEVPEPSVDLKYVGVGLFLLGIGGNFYHHYILSTLRKKGEKVYKIPRGGLFNQVVCAHYLFEILGFVGVTCIAQTLYSLSFTAGSAVYLVGRSYATRKWYLSKFEDFPTNVKALIPYVF